jgi:hypothetical protein
MTPRGQVRLGNRTARLRALEPLDMQLRLPQWEQLAVHSGQEGCSPPALPWQYSRILVSFVSLITFLPAASCTRTSWWRIVASWQGGQSVNPTSPRALKWCLATIPNVSNLHQTALKY